MRPPLPLPLLLWTATTGIPKTSAFPFPPPAVAASPPELRHAAAFVGGWEFADPIANLPTECVLPDPVTPSPEACPATPMGAAAIFSEIGGTSRLSDPAAPHAFKYFENIEKPDADDRTYRIVVLANNLRALLISDPATDMAGAALDVNVGHLSDPEKLPGLAHFCEHLLFQGTDKYPDEAEYSKFIDNHSGFSNAYTSLENTNYYFEVGHQHLEDALDRFAQFFISPRFDPATTEREIHAVDSEHRKNLQSDEWRLQQLHRSLSRPDHPYSKFGTGDLTTLKEIPERLGLNIREELLKFYRRYYSANVMRAAVLGRESIDDLTKLVTEKFGPIVNYNVDVPSWPGSPWGKEEAQRLIRVKPVKDRRSLEIQWPYPDEEEHFASQPSQYIGHLIGHEGRGSILSLLKKKGWANELTAGRIHLARGFDTFYVSVELTPDGLENYEKIIEVVFRYIHLMKKSGVQEHLFNEIRDLSVMDFRFKEKFYAAKYTSNLASLLHKPCPPEWILSMSVVREFRPDLIEESLGHLNGETVQVELVSKEWAPEKTAKEQWYGTEYAVEPISAELRDRIRRALAGGGAETEAGAEEDLHLPLSNAFIPTNFETNKSHVGEPRKRPDLIKSTQLTRLWHKKDDIFWVPKGIMKFHLRSPLAYADARTCVMTNLFVALLRDAVAEFAYDAEVAGLQYSLQSHAEGLLLDVRGFNDKMAALLERVAGKMRNFEVDRERFVVVKEDLDRFYKNIELDAPFRYADFHLNYSTHERLFTPAERMTELQYITAEDVQTHIPNLFSRVHIEALATGNIRREEALAHVETLERLLSPKSLPRSQIVPRRSIVLPKGKMFYYQVPVPDKDEVNSAIIYYTPTGDRGNARQRALLSLLADVTRQPFFDQMRTKEKLGYIAASGMQKQSTTVGLKLVIQSERDTVHLENRIEAFLRNIEGVIGNMTDAEFQRHVDSVIHRKTEKLENIVSESVRFWTNIRSGYYEFDALDNEVEHLRNVTRGELRGFFLERVHPDSAARSKFSVHVRSQRAPRARNPERGAAAAVDAAGLLSRMSAHGSAAANEDAERAAAAGAENREPAVRRVLRDEEGLDERRTEAMLKPVAELLAGPPGSSGGGGEITGRTEDESQQQLVMPQGNVLVEDVVRFIAGCELSRAPQPVILFEDVLSKL